MGGFPVTKGGDLLPAEGVAGAALHWEWQGAGERREYRVIPNITEHVCAGLAPAEGGEGQQGARHAKAGVLAFESRYMRAALGSDDDRYMTLQVEGDSMVPTLLDGDLVAIDISATRINVSGIYVLRFAGQLTIKRVMRKSDGSVLVASDNRAYAAADESFTAAAAETLAVVGRMVWPRVR
jgi:phage repressor protein C with HTH and peptisase S24 domain